MYGRHHHVTFSKGSCDTAFTALCAGCARACLLLAASVADSASSAPGVRYASGTRGWSRPRPQSGGGRAGGAQVPLQVAAERAIAQLYYRREGRTLAAADWNVALSGFAHPPVDDFNLVCAAPPRRSPHALRHHGNVQTRAGCERPICLS